MCLLENPERVVLGFPGVDHDRQTPFAGERNLAGEDRLLDVPRREVVVIVEADLAKPARQRLRVDRGRHRPRRAVGVGGELPRRMRMDADREPDAAPS